MVKKRQTGFLAAYMVLTGLLLPFALPMRWHLPAASRVKDAAPLERSDKVDPSKVDPQATLNNIPLYLIENQGQLDAEVSYYVQRSDMTTYFTDSGLTFALTGREESAQRRWAVKVEFLGARAGVKPRARDQVPTVINYFKGSPNQWKTGLKTYSTIVYADLWPGIDLVYSGAVNQLKYSFVVHPGADPNQIKLAYDGATQVSLTKTGQLEVKTPVGGITDDKPYSYQEIGGQQVEVTSAYRLESRNEAETQVCGFTIGDYDKTKVLVVDPAVLYSGYLGGSGTDYSERIAVDDKNCVYITGWTLSTEATFPVKGGPDLTLNGQFTHDAFIIKVNAGGSGILYAGYIGGSGHDYAKDVAVDCTHNAYITGSTESTQATFPVKGGPDLVYKGAFDAFIVKVDVTGQIVYAGYIGGTAADGGNGIAVDDDGMAYVAGNTNSTASSFPETKGPGLTFKGGLFDAWVAKVNARGTALDYAGYIGGSGNDEANDIAVDQNKNAYVTGFTTSTAATFPETKGPFLTHNGGEFDAFVAKVKDGGVIEYAGYVGGTGDEKAFGIAINNAGNAFIVGQTNSTAQSFPEKGGPGLVLKGLLDGFVAMVNTAGTGLDYAGYIGGSGSDIAQDIAVDSTGNAFITGQTNSQDFPVKVGPDLSYAGITDAFVMKVNPSGNGVEYASYLGGSADDLGRGVAVDKDGNVYVTGVTKSTPATFPVINWLKPGSNGAEDIFVVKIH